MPEQHHAILVHLEYIKAGIDELKEGQLVQNGQLGRHETAIAILKDRADEARNSGAKWGAGVGAGMSALVAGLWQVFGGGK